MAIDGGQILRLNRIVILVFTGGIGPLDIECANGHLGRVRRIDDPGELQAEVMRHFMLYAAICGQSGRENAGATKATDFEHRRRSLYLGCEYASLMARRVGASRLPGMEPRSVSAYLWAVVNQS